MFIVARRKGQKIVIGNDIEIVVAELSRTTVKLGIVAPKPYTILRGEIRENVEEANREALDAARRIAEEQSANAEDAPIDAHLAGAQQFLGKTVKSVPLEDVKPETVK